MSIGGRDFDFFSYSLFLLHSLMLFTLCGSKCLDNYRWEKIYSYHLVTLFFFLIFAHIYSLGERSFEDRNANGGLRWRSDETSDEEEESPNKTIEVGATPMRGLGRRFARK